MLDSQMIPIAWLLRFIRLDAPDVMWRAFHQLTDQATGLISDFTARGGWSGLKSLCFAGSLSRIKFTHQGTESKYNPLFKSFQALTLLKQCLTMISNEKFRT